MLDRTRVAQEITFLSSRLFPDFGAATQLARETWNAILDDPLFQQKAENLKDSLLIPSWGEKLNDTYKIMPLQNDHTVVAIDGSQIYPDRHISGVSCFLLNTGGVVMRYGKKSSASFFSRPSLFLPEDFIQEGLSFTTDLVDLKREELELSLTVQEALKIRKEYADSSEDEKFYQPICFIDGNIVFWHLEGKQPEVKTTYLTSYLWYLEKLYQEKILVHGFISFPKSKELINLLKIKLCPDPTKPHAKKDMCLCQYFDSLIDTHIMRFFLPEHHRTLLFQSNSKIVSQYPDHLKPSFFYLNVGYEIVRIEIPAWIAQNDDFVTRVAQAALDQSVKGRGYPVCLAEAHEQAVVKGSDRDFFFHLLCKIGIDNKKRIKMSQKSLKKRGLGI